MMETSERLARPERDSPPEEPTPITAVWLAPKLNERISMASVLARARPGAAIDDQVCIDCHCKFSFESLFKLRAGEDGSRLPPRVQGSGGFWRPVTSPSTRTKSLQDESPFESRSCSTAVWRQAAGIQEVGSLTKARFPSKVHQANKRISREPTARQSDNTRSQGRNPLFGSTALRSLPGSALSGPFTPGIGPRDPGIFAMRLTSPAPATRPPTEVKQ